MMARFSVSTDGNTHSDPSKSILQTEYVLRRQTNEKPVRLVDDVQNPKSMGRISTRAYPRMRQNVECLGCSLVYCSREVGIVSDGRAKEGQDPQHAWHA